MRPYLLLSITLLLLGVLHSCGEGEKELPMAEKEPRTFGPEGHQVPPFGLITQDKDTLTHEDLADKVHVADFFFTTCPTICPDMSKNMRRFQKRLKKAGYTEEEVMLLSFSVDPRHDSAEVLAEYAKEYGADTDQWKFLTGDREQLYELGNEGYMVAAEESADEPGGYLHSGKFILVDEDRRIRGYYDGTDSTALDRLMGDMRWILEKDSVS